MGVGEAGAGKFKQEGAARVNWRRLARYLGAAIVLIVSVLMVAGMLNLTGDCSLEVRDCGESARRLSFAVLGAGTLALAYLVYRFVRGFSPRG